MIDTSNAVYEAAAEAGIDTNNMDVVDDLEVKPESKEAEGEIKEEEVKEGEGAEDDQEKTSSPEDEKAIEAQPEQVEQPKTVKELEEINAKSEELSLKEKAVTERFAQMEKEFQEKYHERLKAFDEMDAWYESMANNDPDLFDLNKASFQDHRKQFSNPVIDQFKKELEGVKSELDGFKAKASDEVTRTKLEAELNLVKASIGKDAEAAGVKIDWSKVEEKWAANLGLSLEEATLAMYGKSIFKAATSKAKVEIAAKKAEGRPKVSTAGNVQRTNTPAKAHVPEDAFGAVRHFARQLTGKAY